VQGAGSFVGFPSFYMQPDKTRWHGLSACEHTPASNRAATGCPLGRERFASLRMDHVRPSYQPISFLSGETR
jgi:hypothetical protein